MKKLSILLAISMLVSCEEVIEVDLNDADPQLIIEGYINNSKGPFIVRISETTDYFGEQGVSPVDVQGISIYTESGAKEKLERVAAGVYQTTHTAGEPGETYKLEVQRYGQTISGSSTMPAPINITKLHYAYDDREFNPAGEAGYEVSCYFNDPDGIENYYRLRIHRNGELLDDEGLYLYDDKFSDGNEISYTFFDRRFQFGDTIKVDLWSLDEQTYRYYEQLNELIGDFGPGSAAPGNPTSVYDQDVLGVFSAYARNSLEFSITVE